ncbi:MAG: Ni/Fe hydrogenase subunit alpha [Patescibacteria group bacterium]|jgi:coenzyme F420-reducing hydrogenase alpha subunit
MSSSVPKIEGHATFYAHLRAGKVDKARIIGLDGDRFVEKILFGRSYMEVPVITSRICGICPVIHNVTSTKAVENALDIKVSEQVETLRKLMLCGQMVQSHSLHLYLLVLPDFMGMSSSFELQKKHPDIFADAVALKSYADSIIEIIGGRAVHPVSNVPGGFKKFPEISELRKLLEESKKMTDLGIKTLKLFQSFNYPEISRKIIYSALSDLNEYAFYGGEIKTTSGENFKAKDYKKYIYEEILPYNRAKFGTLKGKEMMVGAIARINLNKKQLEKEIGSLKELGVGEELSDNPFGNIIAQAIENYYFIVKSEAIIEKLIKEGISEESIVEPKKIDEGVAACEAPRGTLFHYYKFDKEGMLEKCDIVTPTVQNLPALEYDMKKLGPFLKDLDETERTEMIEMLIRSYDPCITCATH